MAYNRDFRNYGNNRQEEKPKCKHSELEEVKVYRPNYPFGRKSEPRYTFRKIWGYECKRCGERFKIK